MGKIATGNIGIGGLYEWDSGWTRDKADLWNDFWLSESYNHNNRIGVAYTESDSFGKQFYLVGNGVSVYLHPMQTSFTFESSNSAETNNFTLDIDGVKGYLDKLKSFMENNGVKTTWAIEWSVLKAKYAGINNKSYVPDFDGKVFRYESE